MGNHVLNVAILFETALAALFLYTPVVPAYIGIYPVAPEWWIPALPFVVLIWATDETRRFLIRRAETIIIGRFLKEETYY